MRVTNGKLDSCNSCKRLRTSRLHELHESKFPFVTRIEFTYPSETFDFFCFTFFVVLLPTDQTRLQIGGLCVCNARS